MNDKRFKKVSYMARIKNYNYEHGFEQVEFDCFTKDGQLGVNVGTYEVVHIPSGMVLKADFTKQKDAKMFIYNLESYLGDYYQQFLYFADELSKELLGTGKSKLPNNLESVFRRVFATIYSGEFNQFIIEDFIHLCEEK